MNPQKAKILLVEDDSVIIDMYRLKFRLDKLNLLVSPSAAETIKMTEENKPDLILLDLQLEDDINGFDILHQHKARPETQGIPVYIISNKREQDNREKGTKLGAVDFLAKTEIKPKDLIKIVREKLESI